jgi:hypothetical protein
VTINIYQCIISLFMCFIFTSNLLALSHPHGPKGCMNEGYYFQEGQLILTPAKEKSIYFFTNIGRSPIAVTLESNQHYPFPSKMTQTLLRGQWSSFSTMDVKKLQFSCHSLSPDHQLNNPISCEDQLQLCQYKRAQFGGNNSGTYWVIENNPLSGTIKQTIQKGILLR